MKKAKKSASTKLLIAFLALVLVVICTIGGTIAWLVDETNPVPNTFTDSHVNITLAETKTDFKMIPGHTIEKNPVVTVIGGSEACWLFVEIEELDNLNQYIAYAVDTSEGEWKQGDGDGIPQNVYYRRVDESTWDQAFEILCGGVYTDETNLKYAWEDNQVLVLPTVTEQMMNDPMPTLTFTAYAIQLYRANGIAFTPAEAWAQIRPANP